jgi:hypothetical protein
MVVPLLKKENNDNPIIIRPHIVFTDEDNDNPIIIRPHIVLTDRRQQGQPNHNMTTYYVYGGIMIGLSLLSSVSKHTMWSYYDRIYCCFRSSVNTICGRIIIDNPIIIRPTTVFTDGRQQRQPIHNTTTYYVY